MSVQRTPNRSLRLCDALKEASTAFATFMLLKGGRTAQVVANTGLDAVIVDCEHGNVSDSEMHDMVSAVAGAGISPIVRVRGPTLPVIKRALDTGAHAVLIPMINNAVQAREAVSFAKFPPTGVRGQGGPFACYEFGLATPAEYVAAANDLVLVMVQIETSEGLKNVEEICQVRGVDVIFIGPNDLALALLGYAPARGDEVVFLEAIDQVVASARKYGKKTGILAKDGQAAREMKERFDFIALGADARALQAWYGAELSVAKA